MCGNHFFFSFHRCVNIREYSCVIKCICLAWVLRCYRRHLVFISRATMCAWSAIIQFTQTRILHSNQSHNAYVADSDKTSSFFFKLVTRAFVQPGLCIVMHAVLFEGASGLLDGDHFCLSHPATRILQTTRHCISSSDTISRARWLPHNALLCFVVAYTFPLILPSFQLTVLGAKYECRVTITSLFPCYSHLYCVL